MLPIKAEMHNSSHPNDNMKVTFLILSAIALVSAKTINVKEGESKESVFYTTEYSGKGQTGNFFTFSEEVPDLGAYGFDNTIMSSCQLGLWLYYGETNYYITDYIYWSYGINGCLDTGDSVAGATSSLRPAGYDRVLNGNSVTLYDGWGFQGDELMIEIINQWELIGMDQKASSVIITGVEPWTLYTDYWYTGDSVCVYPDTDHMSVNDVQLDYGIYPDITSLGLPDNAVKSLEMGCKSKNVVRGNSGKTGELIQKTANGAIFRAKKPDA